MGVKNLWRLLLPTGHRLSIETLSHQTLAIDASIWLTQISKACRDPETGRLLPNRPHVRIFLLRLMRLLYHQIKPVVVFDGMMPEVKRRELKRRRERREKLWRDDDEDEFGGMGGDDGNIGGGGSSGGGAMKRTAKKILVQKLKELRQQEAKRKRLGGDGDIGSVSVNNGKQKEKEKKSSSKDDNNGAFAPGFNPGGNDSEDSTSASSPKSSTPAESNKSDNDAEDAISIHSSDEAQSTSKLEQQEIEAIDDEAENDWEMDVAVQTSINDSIQNSSNKHIDYADFTTYNSNNGIQSARIQDVDTSNDNVQEVNETIAALPSETRSQWIDSQFKARRLESRQEYLSVAADPENYSSTQLRNFLKGSRLNKRMEEIGKLAGQIGERNSEHLDGGDQGGGINQTSTSSITSERQIQSQQRSLQRLKKQNENDPNIEKDEKEDDDVVFETNTTSKMKVLFGEEDSDDDVGEGRTNGNDSGVVAENSLNNLKVDRNACRVKGAVDDGSDDGYSGGFLPPPKPHHGKSPSRINGIGQHENCHGHNAEAASEVDQDDGDDSGGGFLVPTQPSSSDTLTHSTNSKKNTNEVVVLEDSDDDVGSEAEDLVSNSDDVEVVEVLDDKTSSSMNTDKNTIAQHTSRFLEMYSADQEWENWGVDDTIRAVSHSRANSNQPTVTKLFVKSALNAAHVNNTNDSDSDESDEDLTFLTLGDRSMQAKVIPSVQSEQPKEKPNQTIRQQNWIEKKKHVPVVASRRVDPSSFSAVGTVGATDALHASSTNTVESSGTAAARSIATINCNDQEYEQSDASVDWEDGDDEGERNFESGLDEDLESGSKEPHLMEAQKFDDIESKDKAQNTQTVDVDVNQTITMLKSDEFIDGPHGDNFRMKVATRIGEKDDSIVQIECESASAKLVDNVKSNENLSENVNEDRIGDSEVGRVDDGKEKHHLELEGKGESSRENSIQNEPSVGRHNHISAAESSLHDDNPNVNEFDSYVPNDQNTVALQHAQETAAKLTSWAGRAVQRAIAAHIGQNPEHNVRSEKEDVDLTEESDDEVLNVDVSGDSQEAVIVLEAEPDTIHGGSKKVKNSSTSHVPGRRIDFDTSLEGLNEAQRAILEEEKMMERDMSTITDEMKEDILKLLELCGIPWLESPSEAEAQCAALEGLGLVDGIVTEDSDVFVFGGKKVYKNFFDEQKYVEAYYAEEAKKKLALDKNSFVALAMLLGSDYTDGIKGVGIVNGMEILRAFPVEHGIKDGLNKFRQWLDRFDDPHDLNVPPNGVDGTPSREWLFHKKHVKQRNRWIAPADFPSQAIINAYLKPAVDKSNSKFSWGKPDLEGLQYFCATTLGWGQEEVERVVRPVLKVLESGSKQTRIESYFMKYEDDIKFAKVRSKRLKAVLDDIEKGENGELNESASGVIDGDPSTEQERSEENFKPKKRRRKGN